MKRRLSILAIAVVILVGIGLWYSNRQSEAFPLDYPLGERLLYKLDLSQTIKVTTRVGDELSSTDQAILAAVPAQALQWRGTLELQRLPEDPMTLWFHFKTSETPSLFPEFLSSMSGTIRLNPKGKILAIAYEGKDWKEQATVVRAFFATFDVDFRGESSQKEKHLDYDLLYAWSLRPRGLNQMTGVKSYEQIKGRKSASVTGQFQVLLNRKNLVMDQADLDRSLSYDLSDKLHKEEHFSFHLKRQESGAVTSSSPIRIDALTKDDLSGRAIREYLERSVAERAVSGRDLKGLLGEHISLSGNYDNNFAEADAKIRAWLLLHPEAAQEIGQEAMRYSADDTHFASLIAVIRDVGHHQAQETLRELIRGSDTEPKKQMYLTAYLSDVGNPEVETEEFLMELSKTKDTNPNLGRTAELGLGRMIATLDGIDQSERAADLSIHFLDQLRASKDSEDRHHLWGVLGNSKSPKIWETLETSYNQEKDPTLKKSILAAARFLPNPEAHQLLIQETGAADTATQYTALKSLSFSDTQANDVAVYTAILKNSQDLEVLQQTIKNLGRLLPDHASARDTMKWFVANCAQPDLCALAESYRTK